MGNGSFARLGSVLEGHNNAQDGLGAAFRLRAESPRFKLMQMLAIRVAACLARMRRESRNPPCIARSGAQKAGPGLASIQPSAA